MNRLRRGLAGEDMERVQGGRTEEEGEGDKNGEGEEA